MLSAARERLEFERKKESKNKNDSAVVLFNQHDSLPRALLKDAELSDGAVRAWGVLATHAPTAFPGMRSLGRLLGGTDGAVRKTDELFLRGWIAKVIIHDSFGATVGTTYALFPRKFTSAEMAVLGVGWNDFVVRLSKPGRGKKDKKKRLREQAQTLIRMETELFGGAFGISESGISESETPNERKEKEEDSSEKNYFHNKTGGKAAVKSEPATRSFEKEYGFVWSSGLVSHLEEGKALRICRVHRLDTDQARRVMGELAAEALRGFRVDPESALHHLARAAVGTGRKPIVHTSSGDAHLGEWG